MEMKWPLFCSNCSRQSKGQTVSHKNSSTAQINTHMATLNLTNTHTNTHTHAHCFCALQSSTTRLHQHVTSSSGHEPQDMHPFNNTKDSTRGTPCSSGCFKHQSRTSLRKVTRTISTTTNNAIGHIEENNMHISTSSIPLPSTHLHPPSSDLTQFSLSSKDLIAHSRLKSTRLQIERMKIMWNFTDGARESECIRNCEAFAIPLCGQDKQSWHSIKLICDLAIRFQ